MWFAFYSEKLNFTKQLPTKSIKTKSGRVGKVNSNKNTNPKPTQDKINSSKRKIQVGQDGQFDSNFLKKY
jgi:hypothetical protein